MIVSDISESGNKNYPVLKMTLKYKEVNCSVFFVTHLAEHVMNDYGQTGCELYVRNNAIKEECVPSENCTKYYDNHCKNKTMVYNATCEAQVERLKKTERT
ncbi:hypothetical protein MTO96_040675 [Rhipicephalus appendiculatus]